ncbi:phage terminase small subunit P27 family [Bartonella sp. M0177]|uniref:phage terminase small subunit P27 family n=1 Tax=Bartonella TaxID=773 RepID=UPI0018DE63AF|nr:MULTISPECIES: phage terminase small subunit P27 family [Bartonella]MBI0002764.1 phage terminase small subunit P27 family [Bartonella sp. M0177]
MRGRKPKNMKNDNKAIVSRLQPPRWLSKDAAAEWKRVMPILNERKILTEADIGGLENYCIATGLVREMERNIQDQGAIILRDGMPKRNPAVGIQADAMTRARLLAAELGLTPVSRSRASVGATDDDTLLD